MLKKKALIIAIVCIIAASLIFGFVYDAVVTSIERAEHPLEFSEAVESAELSYGVPKELIYAVIKTESGFDPEAESRAGAIGLMQLLPSTFRWLSDDIEKEGLPDDHVYDPATNIKYGTCYLDFLNSKFHNWETVLAAYNAGPGTVYEWLENPEYSDDGKTLKYIPIGETRAYVRKVSTAYETYKRLYNE